MIVLGIDTSTARSSVAIVEADGGAGDGADLGARVLATAAHEDARGHGAFLAPAVAACLAEAGLDVVALDGVAVGTGPGLYTGLRIGMATASALAWARGLPIAGVGGLDAMVVAARRDPDLAAVPLVAVLDARRGQWFHATAAAAGTATSAPAVGDADAVAAALAAAGPDAHAIGEVPTGLASVDPARPGWTPLRPDAADVALLALPALRAGGVDPAALAPAYLREADVRIGWAERGGGRAVGA